MTADLVISKKNEVFLHIDCEPHVQYELRDAFQFEVPGAKFHPSYRKRHWDGWGKAREGRGPSSEATPLFTTDS